MKMKTFRHEKDPATIKCYSAVGGKCEFSGTPWTCPYTDHSDN